MKMQFVKNFKVKSNYHFLELKGLSEVIPGTWLGRKEDPVVSPSRAGLGEGSGVQPWALICPRELASYLRVPF